MVTAAEVSVVIPLYNGEAWIADTLHSVLCQSYEGRTEIIVVNDGSTDRSVAVAQSVLEGRGVPYQVLEISNGGPSRARNIGWRASQGTWVQFLDADDLLHQQKICVQLERARRLSSEFAVVYSDWQRLALVAGEWLPSGAVVAPRLGDDQLARLLSADNWVPTGSHLIRRAWLERTGGFDERHRIIEDVDLLLRIAIRGGRFEHAVTEFPAFFYRQHAAESLSRRDPRAFVEGCVRNARMVEAHCRDRSELSPHRRAVLADVYLQAARFFAPIDESSFERMVALIESVRPNYVPRGPWRLRWLSRLVGYRQAEKLAVRYRRVRDTAKRWPATLTVRRSSSQAGLVERLLRSRSR
jgi:glycosyltransferase involved in cell wall biosynthesis